jgi:hypothetical protein
VGEVVCDRQGKIWAEITAAATPNATGTFTPVMYISSQNGFRDWIGSPEIDEIYDSPTSYLGAGGIAYSGVNTGTYSAILAAAPGNAPAFRGTVPSELEGLALSGQTQLNQLVGNLLANQNARFPLVKMDLAGNYSNLDIAPQEAIQVTFQPSETVKNVYINSPFRSERHTWKWDAQVLRKELNVELSPIISGLPGQTLTIPTTAPSAGFSVPGLKMPAIPALTLPAFVGGSNNSIVKWRGVVPAGIGFNAYLQMQNPIFSYVQGGIFTGITGSASSLGNFGSHGIYHINLLISQPNINAFAIYWQLSISTHEGIINYYNYNAPSANTITMISDFFEFNAGESLQIYVPTLADQGAGTFALTVQLVFSLP